MLRNGKMYSKPLANATISQDVAATIPYLESIVNLLQKIIHTYDVENIENKNKNNITTMEFINQQIRDYREFYYLVDYYFESLNIPLFSDFVDVCENKANIIISELNEILNRTKRQNGFKLTGNDKINANGLLYDLDQFLRMVKKNI